MALNDQLPALNREFIAHFGEMGSRWGINRTVGQIYALLFLSPKPLCADEIAEGDRREYFGAPDDVWEIFRVLAEERRRREVEPTLTMLRSALQETPATDDERFAQDRMREMHEFISRLMTWFDDVQKLSPETAVQLMSMGSMVTRVFEVKDRLTGRKKDKQ